jgi:hypothetical protein
MAVDNERAHELLSEAVTRYESMDMAWQARRLSLARFLPAPLNARSP